jgi:hypothetical protein
MEETLGLLANYVPPPRRTGESLADIDAQHTMLVGIVRELAKLKGAT